MPVACKYNTALIRAKLIRDPLVGLESFFVYDMLTHYKL